MPVISTNTAANTALRYLNSNASTQSSALAKLASGSNITRASDDAAGLAIATQLQSDVNTFGMAQTNATQANAILQTADGGLSNIANILQRMMALATQSASGNVTNTQRTQDINAEYLQLSSEVNSIATGTRYAGQALLDGSSTFASGVSFMVGTSSVDSISVTVSSSNMTALGLTSLDLTTASGASAAMTTLTTAIGTLTQQRANIGAYESRFNFALQSISTTAENVTAAESTIMDADVAKQKSALSSADVKSQASIAALAQAAKMPQELLSLLQQ